MGWLEGWRAPQSSAMPDHVAVHARKNLRKPERPLLIVEPRPPETETGLVIIFHGAGGSAECFQDLAEAWATELPHVRFLLPTAPVRGNMSAWFGRNAHTGRLGNYQPLWCEILDFIEAARARHNVPLSRVVLLGLSAGALMASWVVQNLPQRCGGLVLLSGCSSTARGRLPEPRMAKGVEETPVLYMHGLADVQVTPKCVRGCVERLLQQGFAVDFQEFPGLGHDMCEEEAEEVLDFLRVVLPKEAADPAELLGCSLRDDIRRLRGGASHVTGSVPNTTRDLKDHGCMQSRRSVSAQHPSRGSRPASAARALC